MGIAKRSLAVAAVAPNSLHVSLMPVSDLRLSSLIVTVEKRDP
jgi:hypothetical protein